MALDKIRRNIRLLREILPRRNLHAEISEEEERIIMEATERFLAAFFRARGFLPENPVASREELRKAVREMEVIKQVLSQEDFKHITTILSEIEDFLGKHEIESAIAKMQALWIFILSKAFPPPPYIA